MSYKKYPNAYAIKPPKTEKKVQLRTEKKNFISIIVAYRNQ